MKTSVQITSIILIFFALSNTACRKDLINNLLPSNEVLTITPERLLSWQGRNWNDIEGMFQNKKDYKYTRVTDPYIQAAVSLPAKDADAPATNFHVLFNIDLNNKLLIIHLNSTDSLDTQTGNKLFLYYYDHALSKMENVNWKWATYNFAQQPPVTPEALLDKVRALNCQQPVLAYRSITREMQAMYSDNGHRFDFDSRGY